MKKYLLFFSFLFSLSAEVMAQPATYAVPFSIGRNNCGNSSGSTILYTFPGVQTRSFDSLYLFNYVSPNLSRNTLINAYFPRLRIGSGTYASSSPSITARDRFSIFGASVSFNPRDGKLYYLWTDYNAAISATLKTYVWRWNPDTTFSTASFTNPAAGILLDTLCSFVYDIGGITFDNSGNAWQLEFSNAPAPYKSRMRKIDFVTRVIDPIPDTLDLIPTVGIGSTIYNVGSGDITLLPNGQMYYVFDNKLYTPDYGSYGGSSHHISSTYIDTIRRPTGATNLVGLAYGNGDLISAFSPGCVYRRIDPVTGDTNNISYTYTAGKGVASSDMSQISAGLGIAKKLVSVTPTGTANQYNVVYDVFIKNYGTTGLTNIQVMDSLSKINGAGNLSNVTTTMLTIPPPPGIGLNPAFNGITDARLLQTTGQNLPNYPIDSSSFTVRINCRISNVLQGVVYYNSAIGTANGYKNVALRDSSTNGNNPDLNQNDKPDDADEGVPTPFVIAIDPINSACATLSSVLYTENFGSGAITAPGLLATLPTSPNTTSSTYTGTTTVPIAKNNFAIVTNANSANTTEFISLTDHTGGANGRMMVVNADNPTRVIFRDTLPTACAGRQYSFSFWAAFPFNSTYQSTCDALGGFRYPKFRVQFRDQATGLTTVADTTTNITLNSWTQFGYRWTMPTGATNLILELVNAAPGGCGNDFVIDDIVYGTCDPLPLVTTNASPACLGDSVRFVGNLSDSSAIPGTKDHQWQVATVAGGPWANIVGATLPYYVINPVLASDTGKYYRIIVAPQGSIAVASCQAISPGVLLSGRKPSTAPTSVTAPSTTFCGTTSVTLTANGGVLGTGANYQWGTGAVVGTSPIAGATSSTYTVSVSSTTTYWVRIENTSSPCQAVTGGTTLTITIRQPSTAPASITGPDVCFPGSTTLTANGAVLGTSANYQWGTGAIVGVTPIVGATGSTLTVSPIVTTTYWVYVTNTASPCTATTGGVIKTVTVNPTPTVNAPSNQALCPGSSTSAVNFSGAVPGTTYSWSNSTTSIGLGASGIGNIPSFTATNAGTTPITATITVTPSYTNAGTTCTGTPQNFTITVNPTPTVTAPSNQTLCSGAPSSLVSFSGAVAGTTYSWSNSNTAIGLGGSGSGNIPSFTATNAGTTPITATITVTPSYSNAGATCSGTPQNFTITVNPTPTVTAPSNQTLCSGAPSSLVNFSGAVAGTTYSWSNSTTSIGLGASGSGNIPSFTATNAGTTPITATITVTPSYTNAGATCSGTPQNFTITVNPTPTVTAPSNQTLCSGAPSSLVNFSGAVAGTTYSWSNSTTSIGLGASGSGNIPSFTATNAGTTPITATITVTPSYTNAGATCSGTPQTFTITVNPTPTVTAPSNQTLCSGAPSSLVNFSGAVAGTTYSWSNSNTSIGLGASGSGNIPSFTATNAGTTPITATITVTPSYTNAGATCSGTPQNFTITVNPTPTVTAPSNQTLCSGAPSSLVNFSGAVAGTTYSWSNSTTSIGLGASGSGNIPSFTATNAGTTAITATITVTPSYTNAGATCSGTPQNFTITVNPTPTVNAPSNQALCPGSSTSAVNFSGAVVGTSYNWSNSNTAVGLGGSGSGNIPSFTATNAGTTPITATITVTPSYTNAGATCSGTPQNFTITVNPTPTVTAPSNQTLCSGAPSSLVSFSGAVAGTTYSWSNSTTSIGLGASGSGNIPSFTATNAGTTPITATITVTPSYTNAGATCSGTPQNFTITVNPTPTVTAPSNQTLCSGAPSSLVNFSGAVVGTSYNWSNSNTAIGLGASGSGNIPSFTATNAGTTAITATITVTPSYTNAGATCSGTPQNFTITVNPTPTVTAPSNQTLCSGAPSSLVNFSGAVAGTTYNWSNSNTAIGLGASGSGNIPSFTATNAGTTPITATITVTPSYTNAGATCSGTPQNFTITVNPTPTVTAPSNQTLCSGAPSSLVNFSGAVVGTSYNWSNSNTAIGLGASGSGNIPSFTATNAGTTAITATITVTPSYTNAGATCSGTPQNFTITVNPTPTVTAPSNQTLCSGAPSSLVNFSGAVAGTTYSWSNSNTAIGLGASGSGNIPSFTATNAGTTPITATITVTPSYTNAGATCSGTPQNFTITVNPTPTVTAPSNQTLCSGAPSSLVSFSGAVAGTTYSWSNSNTAIGLGASGSGNIPSFTATNAGTTAITATITVTPSYTNAGATCSGTPQNFTITVNPTPTVTAPSNQTLCSGAPSSLVNFSGAVAGTTYSWSNSTTSIGLGASGSGNIPSFTATNAGTTPITATITVTPSYTNAGATCSGTPQNFTITVNPTPTVTAPSNQTLCSGAPSSLVSFSGAVAGTTYSWSNSTTSIGLGASGSGNIPSFTATNAGTTPITATITVTPSYTNAGATCSGTPQNFTITVNPTPTVTAPSNQTLCSGAPSSLVNFSGAVAGTTYSWSNSNTSIGLGASGSGNIPSFTATNAGTTPITATITVTPSYTNAGATCSGTPQNFTITVNPTPTVTAPSNQTLCSGAPSSLVSFSGAVAGTTYSWSNSTTSIGLGASGSGNIPSFTAINAGTTAITATITVTPSYTNAGATCSGTPQNFTITVNPTPTVTAPSNQTLCSGAPSSLVNFSGAVVGTSYNWSNSNTAIGLGASGSGNIPSFTATNAGTTPITATITVTPSYTNAGATCSGTPQNFTITVNPTPTVTAPSNQTLCSGAPSSLVSFSGAVAGTTYSWSNSNTAIGLGASGSGNIPSFTATNAGTTPITATITVTPSYTNAGATCSGTPQNFTITVNPTPTVTAPSNQTLCSGAPSSLVSFSGAVAGTTYNWSNSNTAIGLGASGSGNIPSFTATNAGTTAITATITVTPSYTNAGATCSGTPQNFTITVNPTPTVNAPSNQALCPGSPTSAVNFSGAVVGTSYNWSNSNTAIGLGASGSGNIPSFTATNAGTTPIIATITVTPSYTNAGATCSGTPQTFTITVRPTPDVTQPANVSLCRGTVSSAISFSSAVAGTTYTWTNDNTAIGLAASGSGNIPTFTATNTGSTPISGTITVTPTAAGCPGPSRTFTITVNLASTAPTSVTGPDICNGASTTLTANGAVLGTGANYQWGTGSVVGANPIAGATSSTLTVSPTVTTTYWVRIENGVSPCAVTTGGVTKVITVNQPSVAATSANKNKNNICPGIVAKIFRTGGTIGTGATWKWYTGSPGGTLIGSGDTLTVTPLVTTTYYVRAEGFCNTTAAQSVTIFISCDIDKDKDGIPDFVESNIAAATANGYNTSYPGYVDYNNDFINDNFEADGDSDNDGIPNYLDTDFPGRVDINSDGIDDRFDTDLDGVINMLDLDSDNDGIPDVVEAYGVDANGDGKIDNFTDTDGDGLSQNVDGNSSGANNSGIGLGVINFDNDAVPNFLDLDSDNDGIPDVVEAGGPDTNNDGKIDGFVDANGDGMHDGYINATALLKTGADTNNDGRADSYPDKNMDRDFRPNAYDLDSDGDGIVDVIEAGLPDVNLNGIVDGTFGANGWSTTVSAMASLNLRSSDADGKPDYLDIDADNDGIPDNIEGQSTANYKLPTLIDADGDGIMNPYDNLPAAFGGSGIYVYDHDGDGTPDYRDLDSDADGLSDRVEGNDFNLNGLPDDNVTLTGLDTDGDGLDNRFDSLNSVTNIKGTSYRMGTNGSFTGDPTPGSRCTVQKTWAYQTDRDWRYSGYVLPVQFLNLTGVLQKDKVLLNWTVIADKEVDHFEVERSIDNRTFIKTGIVSQTVLLNVQQRLAFTDDITGVNKDVIYYRIKVIGKAGEIQYSNILIIRRQQTKPELIIMPNPANEYVYIGFNTEKESAVTIRLIDEAGKLVLLENRKVSRGSNTLQLTGLTKYSNGNYYLQIFVNDEVLTKKLVILH